MIWETFTELYENFNDRTKGRKAEYDSEILSSWSPEGGF